MWRDRWWRTTASNSPTAPRRRVDGVEESATRETDAGAHGELFLSGRFRFGERGSPFFPGLFFLFRDGFRFFAGLGLGGGPRLRGGGLLGFGASSSFGGRVDLG